MSQLEILDAEGNKQTLDSQTMEQFAASVRGQVVRSGDDGYDEARSVWNGMIDRRPAMNATAAIDA